MSLALSELVVDKTKRKTRRELSEGTEQEIKDKFFCKDCFIIWLFPFNPKGVGQCRGPWGLCKKILKIMTGEAHTGKSPFEDFNEVVTDWILERDPHEEILKAFKLFDDDDSGKISLRNLRRVARELGENMSDEELRAMIEEFDKDGDGEINQEEFIAIMTGDI
uniref:EF-hand domain-containing protein n=1 Tax=Rhinopithecus bieti TaxID=61621 RepID=A0A2K6MQW7_RHIBE